MQIKCSKFINAPVEKVFDVFSDISKLQERVEGITKVEILSDAKKGLGAKWVETRIMFGKEATEEMEISELDQNKSYAVTADSNGTKYRSVYTFSQQDGGTLVEMTFEGKPYTFFAKLMSFMVVFMKSSLLKALDQDMEDLKKICEAN